MAQSQVQIDVAEFRKRMDYIGAEAIPRSIADALTSIAFIGQKELNSEVLRVFDRPVEFTKKAFGVEKASYKKSPIESAVFVRPAQREYLRLQITGGERKEGDYATVGGGVLVPVEVKTDRAGGIPQGPKRFLGSLEEKYKNAFVLKTKTGFLGVFQRQRSARGKAKSSGLKLLAAFTQTASYETKLGFFFVVRNAFNRDFQEIFSQNFDKNVKRRASR